MENLYIEFIQWRSIERLVSIIIGGLSIAAGWHLFLKGVVQEQSADINIQTIKVGLQKVGPGIFFALFGAWMVVNIINTKASLEGFQTPNLATNTPTPIIVKHGYLSGGQDSWQLKFVAATKQLDQQGALLNQALAKLENPDSDEIRMLRTALLDLSISRKKFLIEAFPPSLRDACKNEAPMPAGYTQDSCELFKEYANAVSR